MSDELQRQPADRGSWSNRLVARPCTVITRLVSESLDRRLSLLEKLQVRAHLRLCVWCSRYERQITGLQANLRLGADRIGPEASLSPEVRARLKTQLTAAWAAQACLPAAPPMPRVWLLRFALAPGLAYVLASTSQWCITCLETEGAGGAGLRALHAVVSWPMFAIRLLSTQEYTPTGFPLCCFGGWSGLLILLVAAWYYASRGPDQAAGRP